MQEITCMCEHKFKVAVPKEIDLESKPETLTAILDGTWLNITCPSCKTVLKPEFPVMLSHKKNGWQIAFVPELSRQESIKSLKSSQAGGMARLVIGYPELVEKMRILSEKLDDRTVEYLKYAILSKVLEKTDNEDQEINLYFDKLEAKQLVFAIEGLKEGELGLFKIPLATYDKTLSEINTRANQEPFSEFLTPPYVSLHQLYSWDDL